MSNADEFKEAKLIVSNYNDASVNSPSRAEASMTKEQYLELRSEGESLLKTIHVELNEISDQFIRDRKNDIEDSNHRRMEDWHEVAVALALLKRHQEEMQGRARVLTMSLNAFEE